MKKRSRDPELIDLGFNHYTLEEYNGCLYQLGRIGKYLGNYKQMLKLLSEYEFNSLLDVGCGGGFFTTQIAKRFNSAKVIGIDICSQAIEYAVNQKKNCAVKNSLDNLNFELRKSAELNEPLKSVDVIVSTLVLHHLSDEEIINFFKKTKSIAKKAIVINDLHRNWIAYIGCKFIMPLFFPNRLVKKDSLLSIKKSFKYHDWIHYLEKAGFNKRNYRISWHWPFRWIVEIKI